MIHFEQKFGRLRSPPAPDLEQVAALTTPPLRRVEVLSGGYSTFNFSALTAGGQRAVLRWRPGDARTLDTELAAARHVRDTVEVPEVLTRGEDWALLTWIDGARVDRLLEDHALRGEWRAIGRACGEALASVHAHAFDQAGFFAPDLSIAAPLEGAGASQCQRAHLVATYLNPRGNLAVQTVS